MISNRRLWPLLAFVVSLVMPATLPAQTYSQPFASGHGFAPTQSGACDNSYTDNAADSTNGNPVNSVNSICNGRNDNPTTTWKKSLTWEAMGVTPGATVNTVNGKFDHAIIARTHTSQPRVGPLEIMNSGETASCMASTPNEAELTYDSGTGGTSWATQDATGAIAVVAGCQASTTTVVVRFGISPRSGNNAAANTQVNVDNLVLTIVASSGETYEAAITVSLTTGQVYAGNYSALSSLTVSTTSGYTAAPSNAMPVAASFATTGMIMLDGSTEIFPAITALATSGYSTATFVGHAPTLTLAASGVFSNATRGDWVGSTSYAVVSGVSPVGDTGIPVALSASVTGAFTTASGLSLYGTVSLAATSGYVLAGSLEIPSAISAAATSVYLTAAFVGHSPSVSLASVGVTGLNSTVDFVSLLTATSATGFVTNGGSEFLENIVAGMTSEYVTATFVGHEPTISTVAAMGTVWATQADFVGTGSYVASAGYTPLGNTSFLSALSMGATSGFVTNGGSDFSEAISTTVIGAYSTATIVGYAPVVSLAAATGTVWSTRADFVGAANYAAISGHSLAEYADYPVSLSASVAGGYSTVTFVGHTPPISLAAISGFSPVVIGSLQVATSYAVVGGHSSVVRLDAPAALTASLLTGLSWLDELSGGGGTVFNEAVAFSGLSSVGVSALLSTVRQLVFSAEVKIAVYQLLSVEDAPPPRRTIDVRGPPTTAEPGRPRETIEPERPRR